MAIEPHVHEYELKGRTDHTMTGLRFTPVAFCKHPECDHELDTEEILGYLNWVEKYKDGLKQIGADF